MDDIKKIKNLVKKVLGSDCEIIKIERIGGLSNRNYYTKTSKGDYSIRLAGYGTSKITNRKDEKISTLLANETGIDAELIYFDEISGDKISKFIKNGITMSPSSLKEASNIIHITKIYKKLHNCKKNTGIIFNIENITSNYENIINNSDVDYFDDFFEVKKFVKPFILNQVNSKNKVPCHNDPVCENWILEKTQVPEKMYLIDWEYGAMNNPIWDLALVSCEAGFGEKEDNILLKNYYNDFDIENIKELFEYKIVIDYYLSLWAKTRIPYDNQIMIDYSCEHYKRMKKNIEIYLKI